MPKSLDLFIILRGRAFRDFSYLYDFTFKETLPYSVSFKEALQNTLTRLFFEIFLDLAMEQARLIPTVRADKIFCETFTGNTQW